MTNHESQPADPAIPIDSHAEQQELEPQEGPRIYVASLSDYNAGVLHGSWLDATDDVAAMQRGIDEMLTRSPTAQQHGDAAEEWAIHDYEGFGHLRLGEHESLATITRLATGISRHGPAFAAYASVIGIHDTGELEDFEDHYRGEWESVRSYAADLLAELGVNQYITEMSDWIQPYISIDVDGFARDLELGGDFIAVERPDGRAWIFVR